MTVDCLRCRRHYNVSKYKPGQRLRCACGQVIEVPAPTGARSERVHAFHCEGCGGPLKRGSRTCPFCNAAVDVSGTLLTVYCPGCLTSSKAGARYCSGCGASLSETVNAPSPASECCPRCRVRMRRRPLGAHKVLECPMCVGVFVAVDAFANLIRSQEARAGEGAPTDPRPQGGPDSATVTYIRCPVCSNTMNRTNYGRISGVIVDYCRDHGYWLDNGELERIADWVAAGGLKKQYQRELEEARSEARRARLSRVGAEPLGRLRATDTTSCALGGDGFDILSFISRLFD